MEKFKTIRVYNLVNSKGNQLQLVLGRTDVQRDGGPWSSADNGYRWRFIGRKIPMPVRSMYWFNGFPADTMLLWLAEHDWYVETEVDMNTGKAKAFGLPEPEDMYSDEQFADDEQVFKNLIKDLLCAGDYGKAIQLCRYAYEIGTDGAVERVHEIGKE